MRCAVEVPVNHLNQWRRGVSAVCTLRLGAEVVQCGQGAVQRKPKYGSRVEETAVPGGAVKVPVCCLNNIRRLVAVHTTALGAKAVKRCELSFWAKSENSASGKA